MLIDRLVARQSKAFTAECAQVIDMLVFVADARSHGEATGGGVGGKAGQKIGQLEAEAAVHELSLALLVPVGVLQRVLAAARYARARLPHVWDAWSGGRLGAGHVGLIVATTERLERPGSITHLDTIVVDIATSRTLEQLRRWLARFVDRAEPDLAEHRHRQARRERRVHLETGDDGMSWLMALLPSTEAAAIDHKIEQAARKQPSDARTHPQRTHSQRRADAFSALLLGNSTSTGDTNAPRIDIGVVVPIQSVMGLSDAPAN